MLILAIETSCDETAAAVVEDGWKVISNVIASSLALHQKTRGVVPEIAARAQIESIIPVIKEALEQAFPKKGIEEQSTMIDAIAVTTEPGLVTSLIVGTETAKWLSWLWKKPLIKVNHVHGHVYANWLERDPTKDPIKFPVISLSVSGGHNDLILILEDGHLEIIGQTQDDAAGEAFDKVARVLGLGYPGGPDIERVAKRHFVIPSEAEESLVFPRAWLNKNRHIKTWDGTSFDFSFSGLKSEVIREVQRRARDSSIPPQLKRAGSVGMEKGDIIEIADAFQEAVFDVLATKLMGAAKKLHAKEIHLAGGVSANKRFREIVQARLQRQCGPGQSPESAIVFRTPKKMIYCTDNAAMIGARAFFSTTEPSSISPKKKV